MTAFLRKQPFLLLIILLFFAFRVYTYSVLPFNYLITDQILIFALLGQSVILTWAATFLIGFLNLLLIWFILRRFFNSQVCLLVVFLYSISPWTVFFDLSGSIYVLITFALLILLLGLVILQSSYTFGTVFYLTGFVVLVCTSFLFWPAAVVIFFLTFLFKKDAVWKKNLLTVLPPFLFLLIVFMSLHNLAAMKNLFRTQVSIFTDVGLINSVNNSRGELRQSGFEKIGKVVENRYIYLSEHTIFNFLKQFDPWILFTPKVGLFGRSFTSPIPIGFLIPYIIGLSFMVKNLLRQKKFFLLILTLILPSVLDQKSPNLSKLLVISPFIYTTITLGFYYLVSGLNLTSPRLIFTKNYSDWFAFVRLPVTKRLAKLLLWLVVTAFTVQIVVTLADLMIRESGRFILAS